MLNVNIYHTFEYILADGFPVFAEMGGGGGGGGGGGMLWWGGCDMVQWETPVYLYSGDTNLVTRNF